MGEFKEKSNNEILQEIQNMKVDHEGLKQKILYFYDELELIEKKYQEANKELTKRLNGK